MKTLLISFSFQIFEWKTRNSTLILWIQKNEKELKSQQRMITWTLISSCFDYFFVNKSLELPFHLTFFVICCPDTMNSLNEWNWNSIKLFILFWHCLFSKILLISFRESLFVHLKMIYSNVRGYRVFIQKNFIPPFLKSRQRKTNEICFQWYLVPQVIRQGRIFWFLSEYNQVFEQVNKEILIMNSFMLWGFWMKFIVFKID